MINPNCRSCCGLGWVCENHPERAWDEALGCQCGAGMLCECQHADGLEPPDISKIMEEEPVMFVEVIPRSSE